MALIFGQKVSNPSDSPPTQTEAIKAELLVLMRRKKMQGTPLSEFPNLAKLLGSEDDDGASIREHIRSTLVEVEAHEQRTEMTQKRERVRPDPPFAKVAMILLGLTPRSEHKTIGRRRELAVTIRGGSLRTLRRHEPEIARRLAIHLCAEAATRRGTPNLAPVAVTYPSLTALGYEDCAAMLATVDQGQVRSLFRELVRSYDAVAAAFGGLSLEWFTSPPGTARTFFTALRLLGERGFQDERFELPRSEIENEHGWAQMVFAFNMFPMRTLRHQVMLRTVWGEKSGESRYALAVYVLREIEQLLPAWPQTARQHLERVAREADGHDFTFVEEMERTELGCRILSRWASMSACLCDVEGISHHNALRQGFRFLGELLDPGGDRRLNRKELNRYLDTAGGTDPLIPYVRGVESDADYAGFLQWLVAERGVRAVAFERFTADKNSRGDTDSVVW